jgi:hypothetical protein
LAGAPADITLAFALSRARAGLLNAVEPRDLTFIAGVALSLLITSLVAGYAPARRATGVDPIAALRAGRDPDAIGCGAEGPT